MENRLIGIVATLWFFIALLSLFVALVLSPMGLRLLLPGSHPSTWLYPALLTIPPVVLASRNLLGRTVSRPLLWLLVTALAVFTMLLFGFLGSIFVGH